MFCQMFLSPQVKQSAIITYKHRVYELPNDLSLPAKNKSFLLILAKISRKTEIKLFTLHEN